MKASYRGGVTAAPSLAEFVEKGAESGKFQLAPLPAIAYRILEVTNDDDADPRRLTDLIENEPAVSSAVLRIANSATFAGMPALARIDSAIARLGLQEVGLVATAAIHKGRFDHNSPERQKLMLTLWTHSITVALGARRLAASTGVDASEAFLGGLLHDVGRLLVLQGVDAFERAHKTSTPADSLLDLMEVLHARLGHRVLASWRMAPPVCDVALRHHESARPEDQLLATVQVADEIARKMGASLVPNPLLDVTQHAAIEVLRLDELELAEIMVDIEDELVRVRGLF